MAKKAFIVGANTLGLKYAQSDADLMRECLTKYEFVANVVDAKIMQDKWKFLKQLEQWTKDADKTDLCIFYFSGHGTIITGELNLLIDNDDTINVGFITMPFKACKASSKLIILDCCHAGAVHADWNPDSSDAYRLLTASERLEKTKELEEFKASFFTYYFHKALMNHAHEVAEPADGGIRINELYKWLKEKTKIHNAQPHAAQAPLPNLLGNNKANIELGSVASLCHVLGKKEQTKIIDDYYSEVKLRFSTINLFGERNFSGDDSQTVFDRMSHIDSGFVPLHLRDWSDENDSGQTGRLEISDLFFTDHSPRHVLLRGLPGSGKTTLLHYLTYRYACMGADGKKKIVPVYMRCKEFLKDESLEKFVEDKINERCENLACFKILKDENCFLETPMVLLFDGLDEIEDEAVGVNFKQKLAALKKEHPRCKIIVASRPIGLKLEDFRAFRSLDVLRLEDEMIEKYLNKWFDSDKTKVNDLWKTFKAKPRIKTLASNPFLLSMICYTYNKGSDAALIERRSELYANCTQYLLKRSYDDPSGASNPTQDYKKTLQLLKEISLRFFLWQEADFSVDHVNVIGRRILTAEAIGKTDDFLDDVQRRTGLILRVKEGFTFVHRSLWEYFTALAMRDRDVKSDFLIKQAANPDWEEVVRLYAGLLCKKEAVERLIKDLWNINRPLALRVTTEVKFPAADMIKSLIEKEEGVQSKALLIEALEQSLPLIPQEERKNLIEETLTILLIECKEKDCDAIYYAQRFLQRQGMDPLEPGGLIYRLLELQDASKRRQDFLDDPANCFEWVKVEGGTFLMGDDEHEEDEKPAHSVKVDSFLMTKHPVTNRFLSSFPLGKKYPSDGGDNHPAIANTWWEAYYFALWIGALLPTEAQWEYAARGGQYNKKKQFYFGDSEEELKNHAWFNESEKRNAYAVDELNPRTGKENLNPLGLANMLGNVREWCSDWYGGEYYNECNSRGTVENPSGPNTGSYRVVRGGYWGNAARNCRCAYRHYFAPADRGIGDGFRLVFVP